MIEYDEKRIREDYRNLTKKLIEKNITISTMESATSGQIASLITDTEGASAIFSGGYVSYSNEVKIKLGVPKGIIEQYSVYSKETATAMANVCANAFGSDIGIGVTGTMGNVDPNNESFSTPGRVYVAIYFKGETKAYEHSIEPMASRLMYKLAVASKIYELIITMI